MQILLDNPHFIDGWQAYHVGLPPQANPILFEANPYRLWNCGYTVAKLIDLASQGVFDLPGDDIGEGESEGPIYRRIEKSPFVQGQVAYAKCIALDQCPYGLTSTDYSDWQAGWIFEQDRQPELRLDLEAPAMRLGWLAWLASHWPFKRA